MKLQGDGQSVSGTVTVAHGAGSCHHAPGKRTTGLEDLPDTACPEETIGRHSRALGHVPLIDGNPRHDKALAQALQAAAQRPGFALAEQVRYHERTADERVDGRLQDACGSRPARLQSASQKMRPGRFGWPAFPADQLLRLGA